MKRILLTTFPSAFLYHGGGEREISLLNEALNHAGILSDIYGPTSLPLTSYDCVIHFSMHGGSEVMVAAMAEPGRRLILWPNLWFVTEPSAEQIENLSQLLSYFDAIIFKSKAEQRHFSRYLSLEGKDIILIPPLISPKFLRSDITTVFKTSYGLGDYAIWPGIIEPQKNQLAAIEAFSDLDITLVISGSIRNADYANLCMETAGANVMFIPPMPFGSELHLSALTHSKLFIELPLDFPGTSALEAAMLGCNLVLSASSWTEEMLGTSCIQVDPHDSVAIRGAVKNAVALPSLSQRSVRPNRPLASDAVQPLLQYLS